MNNNDNIDKGLGSADQETRERVARQGGLARGRQQKGGKSSRNQNDNDSDNSNNE